MIVAATDLCHRQWTRRARVNILRPSRCVNSRLATVRDRDILIHQATLDPRHVRSAARCTDQLAYITCTQRMCYSFTVSYFHTIRYDTIEEFNVDKQECPAVADKPLATTR